MDVQTNKISFCSGDAENITRIEDKHHIIEKLKKYNVFVKTNRASILNEKSIKFLNNPHLISVKTVGTNYFLFLTKFNNINCCFYIDRKIKQGYTCPRIISVKYLFDDCVFNDTLFDGELVKDSDNNWMFLVSDIIIKEGVNQKTVNIAERFKSIYGILSNKYRKNSDFEICPLFVKKMFTYSQYNFMITSFIHSLSYGVRGLYFNSLTPKHHNQLYIYPKTDKIKPNSNKTKYIPSRDILKTFELRKTIQPDIYDLYCMNNTDVVKFETARIPTLKVSKLVSKLFDTCDHVYVECRFNKNFNKWEPQNESSKEKIININHI